MALQLQQLTKKAGIIAGVWASSLMLAAQPVAAQTMKWGDRCITDTKGNVGVGDVATIIGLQCLIANVLMTALTLIGLAGFAMMIYGAFRYMLSGGNTKAAENAQGTITFAVVGLVVAVSAFIVLNLIASFTGISPSILTGFNISIENNPLVVPQ